MTGSRSASAKGKLQASAPFEADLVKGESRGGGGGGVRRHVIQVAYVRYGRPLGAQERGRGRHPALDPPLDFVGYFPFPHMLAVFAQGRAVVSKSSEHLVARKSVRPSLPPPCPSPTNISYGRVTTSRNMHYESVRRKLRSHSHVHGNTHTRTHTDMCSCTCG